MAKRTLGVGSSAGIFTAGRVSFHRKFLNEINRTPNRAIADLGGPLVIATQGLRVDVPLKVKKVRLPGTSHTKKH